MALTHVKAAGIPTRDNDDHEGVLPIANGGTGAADGFTEALARIRYLYALQVTPPHALVDDTIEDAALAVPATKAAALALANSLKALFLAHMLDVADFTTAGLHKAAETTIHDDLEAIPDAIVDDAEDPLVIDTLAALIIGLQVAADAHATSANKHFGDDATLGAVVYTAALVGDIALIADAYVSLGEILDALTDHFALGTV
jgi:hypothetical protein